VGFDHLVVGSENSESVGCVVWVTLFFIEFDCEVFVCFDDCWVVGLEGGWFVHVVHGSECSGTDDGGNSGGDQCDLPNLHFLNF